MSKINELIQTLCPDGVEYKKLGGLFSFKNGISKNKSFFGHGQPIINFTDVYHHARLYSTMIKGLVDATDSELERFDVCKGDCFFTRTSETKEDIGRASVIVDDIENCVFSGFLIKGHPITDLLMPEYCSYCFNSGDFRKTIVENANMTTRATITGEILSKIEIPVPSLPVQEEIVRILDEYTRLEAELEAKLSEEIELKQKQYEVYRDELLTFGDDVEYKKLKDVSSFVNGKGHEKNIVNDGRYIVVNSKFVSTNGIVKKYSDVQICPLHIDDILMVMSDLPNGRALAKCYLVDENDKYTLNQRIGCFHTLNENIISTKFLFNVLNRNYQLLSYDNGIDQTNLRKDAILNIDIPVPSPTEQQRIVKILDKYDTYTRDMISALNTELESRKKQYAYYRDQLLTFKRKE